MDTMGLFDTVEAMPTEGAIRGLTGEAAEEADKAIQDGKVRSVVWNADTEKLVGAIKRYLSQQGWGCKVRVVAGKAYWQVVEKKEMTPEHKAKMLDALAKARAKKEAEKATAAQAPAETPTAPVEPANGASKATKPAVKANA